MTKPKPKPTAEADIRTDIPAGGVANGDADEGTAPARANGKAKTKAQAKAKPKAKPKAKTKAKTKAKARANGASRAKSASRAAPKAKAKAGSTGSTARRAPGAQDNVAVMVFGMHRSGTSVLTRAFNLLGYAAPRNRIGINKTNQTGHWESRAIARFNDALLSDMGQTWQSWLRVDLRTLPTRRRSEAVQDARHLLATEFDDAPALVVKEPRLCRLAPLWLEAAQSAFAVRAVLPLRNPLEVMASLEARNGTSPEDGALLWLRYSLDAELATRGVVRAFPRYEDMLEDPIAEMQSLVRALDLDPPFAVGDMERVLEELLDPDLRNHTESAEALAHSPVTEGWVSRAYEALRHLNRDPNNAAAMAQLDGIRAALDGAQPMLRALSEARQAERDSASAAAEAAAKASERAAAKARDTIETLTAQKEAAQAKAREARTANADKAADGAPDLSGEARALRDRVEALQAEHHTLTARLYRMENERTALSTAAERARADVEALQAAYEAAQAEAREAARAANARLAAETAEVSSARADASSAKAEAAALRDTLQAETDALARKWRKAQRDYTKAVEEIRDRDGRLKDQRSRIRNLERENWRLHDRISVMSDHQAAMLASTSWKITKPMRSMKRVVSGARDRSGAEGRDRKRLGAPDAPKRLTHDRTATDTPRIAASPPGSGAGGASAVPGAITERQLRESGLFDPVYYIAHAPDVATSDQEPLQHFLSEGWRKHNNPSPRFNTAAYLASNPEAAEHEFGPLGHYLAVTGPRTPAPARKDVGRVVVFGAVSGGYDAIKEPLVNPPGVDYVIFTDGQVNPASAWQERPFEFVSPDPTRTARFIKTHPHLYFKDYDWAVWVDANLHIDTDMRDLIAAIPQNAELATWHHPLRSTVAEEVAACTQRTKDDADTLERQMERYRNEGFPDDVGLWETSVFAASMTSPKVELFMNAWWAEILKGSRRDQIALPYVKWKTGMGIATIAPQGVCMRSDPRFHYYRHLTS